LNFCRKAGSSKYSSFRLSERLCWEDALSLEDPMNRKIIVNACQFISDALASITETVSSVAMVLVLLSILIQVILRYVFHTGIVWVEEFAKYSIIWAVLLCAGILIKNDELIKVDFLDNFWSTRFIKYRNAVHKVLFLMVFLTLIKEGWEQAINAWVSGSRLTTLSINYFWVYVSIPIGASIMAVQLVISSALKAYHRKTIASTGSREEK
jgi:TRAP-type transport system small permease protein